MRKYWGAKWFEMTKTVKELDCAGPNAVYVKSERRKDFYREIATTKVDVLF